MDEPSSIFAPEFLPGESRCKIQRLVDQRMENIKQVREENIKRSRDESQSSKQNDHAAQACAQNNFLESSRKYQRLYVEKNNLPQNEAQSIAQNGHILQVHPVQNSLSPQQCFSNRNQHLPGHSSCPPLYLPPQYFNMPGGLSDSRYAPLAPPPVLHGYGNYQPLRHQPPPLKQEWPSSEFEPHKAPQPYFNRNNVASYHGYSQQFPALTHLPMAHTQAMATTNSSASRFPSLRSACLFVLAAATSTGVSVQLTPSGVWIS